MGSLSYRVLDCPDKAPLIHVDDNGHLMSGSLTGTASLQITVQESFGVNQTIILAVKVHPLSYPYIHLNTQIHVNGGGLGVGGGVLGSGRRGFGCGGGGDLWVWEAGVWVWEAGSWVWEVVLVVLMFLLLNVCRW